jgi:hypothetical protein
MKKVRSFPAAANLIRLSNFIMKNNIFYEVEGRADPPGSGY